MRGGIAERGGVRVGHRIIEINGQSVVATPHEKIVHILSNAVGEVGVGRRSGSSGAPRLGLTQVLRRPSRKCPSPIPNTPPPREQCLRPEFKPIPERWSESNSET